MFPRLLAVLLLSVSPLVLTQVAAQQPPKPGAARPAAPAAAPHVAAPAAPHFAAPAPHFAAPAPHFAAPAPHFAAPAPHFAAPAPHFAAPAPHFAAPRAAAPHFAAPSHAPSPRFAAPSAPSRQQRIAESRGRSQPPAHARSADRAQARQELRQAAHQGRGEDRQQARQLQAQQHQHLQELRAQGQHLDRNALRQQRAQDQQQLRDLRAQQHDQRLGRQNRPSQDQQGQDQQGQKLRNGMARVTPDAARQGRFAAAFEHEHGREGGREQTERSAPWQAWHNHHRAAFVAWAGPVFWPYAYNDVFYQTFWPEAYDNGYWAYAYDDFFDGVYWAGGNPYSDYAYAGPTTESAGLVPGRARHGRGQPAGQPAGVAQNVCEPAKGVTAWPFEQIASAVQPTEQQRPLLDELKAAAKQAADDFKASCSGTFALTPPGRLQAMLARVQATLDAVHIVRPPLEKFYASLSDEQKARFNAVGPEVALQVRNARTQPQGGQANACGEQKPGLTNLPIERLDDVLRPTDAQQAALDALRKANEKAVAILQAACPDGVAQTPVGRLDAMDKRLTAMVQAAKTVQPSLQDFYSSLSNEQKARFNTLGQEAQR